MTLTTASAFRSSTLPATAPGPLPIPGARARLPRLPSPWRARLPVLVALLAVYLTWSSTYAALRVVALELPVFLAVGARFVVAGLILLGILRWRGAAWPSGREWLASLPVGAALLLVGNGLVALAERTATSGAAAVACGMTPLWAVVLGRLYGERSTAREWTGVLVGMAGVLALSLGSARGTPTAMLLLVLAPLGWAFGSVLSKRLPLPAGLMSAATEMICGGACLLLVGVVLGESLPRQVSTSAWLAMGHLVVFGSLIGFSAFNYLLRTTPSSVALSYAYVNPALAVILGAVALGEPLGLATLLATGLVVAAVVTLVRR